MRKCLIALLVVAAAAHALGQAPSKQEPASDNPAQTDAAMVALSVGDKAPALSINRWIKGEPVAAFEKDKVYIVEFWATWCPPCRKSIPHLTELQARYKDKAVTIIGISSQEQNGLKDVEPFVWKQGDKMGYTVAWDDAGKTSKAWMDASGQQGIPTAFIVNQESRIAWIGHPMSGMDSALERIVNKTFDLEKEAAKAKHRAEVEAKAEPLMIRVQEAMSRGDTKGALAAMDEIIALDAEVMGEWAFYKFQLMAAELQDYDGAYAFAAKAVEGPLKGNASVLNALAWMILVEPGLERRDTGLALKAARRANELTGDKDPAIIDTLAKACFETGDVAAAVAHQTRGVALAPEGDLREQMQVRLAEYQKAAQTAKD